MIKILSKKFKKKLKKNPFLPVVLVVIFLILGIGINLIYDVFVEKESIKSNYFSIKEDDNFNNIVNSQIKNSDDLIIQRIDSDLRALLEKNFGKVKFDRNLFIKSKSRENWHLFYFTQKAPDLDNFQQKFIYDVENLVYTKKKYDNSRTYEYTLDFQKEKYLVIVNLLSYNNDDTMGIYMIYVEKLK